jgi:hypothetical protein
MILLSTLGLVFAGLGLGHPFFWNGFLIHLEIIRGLIIYGCSVGTGLFGIVCFGLASINFFSIAGYFFFQEHFFRRCYDGEEEKRKIHARQF